MARRKLKELDEENSSTKKTRKSNKQPNTADAIPSQQIKRKIKESEESDANNHLKRKKSSRISAKEATESKFDTNVKNLSTSSDTEDTTTVENQNTKNKSKLRNNSSKNENDSKTKKPLQKKSKTISVSKEKSKSNKIPNCEKVDTPSQKKTPAKNKNRKTTNKTLPETVPTKGDLEKLKENCEENLATVSETLLKNEKFSPVKTETKSPTTNFKQSDSGENSSSDEEWEEVKENDQSDLDNYNPEIPKEGVEITIDCPDLKIQKRKKKEFDWQDFVRLNINRQRKECQLNIHKTHLLCLLAHGFYVNSILNSPVLKGFALSLIPLDMLNVMSGKKCDKIDVTGVEYIVKWFRKTFAFESENSPFIYFSESIVSCFENQNALNVSEYNLMFVTLARILGLKTRFCISLYPLTYKAKDLIKKSKTNKESKNEQSMGDDNISEDAGPSKPKKEMPKSSPTKSKKKKVPKKKIKETKSSSAKSSTGSRPKRSVEKNYKISDDESDQDDEEYTVSDDDFEEQNTLRKSITKTAKQKSNRRVLSSDSASSSPKPFTTGNIICWAEVFSKPDKQWIPVECVNNIIDKPYDIEEKLPDPVTYIVGFDNDSFVKDVTRRYCSNYMTSTIKLRADPDWWEKTLMPFSPPVSKLDKEEENKLENLLINKPLPTTVAGFKNHPLYALERHLLKFEAIYPPDAAPVGYMRKEPVYPRECVCQLHSRETWLKEARVVRIGEVPYKIVKARPKWDRIAGVMRTDLPLDVFGFWQTEPYEPPIAVNGKVPRNEYGNVELFKSCMLPKGTVHLQLPGLNRVAKKLGIDCCPAVVGFDGHKGSVHAVFDGFIICEEFKDTIIAAWDEEQVNAQKREEEKREKRIYGNWRKLIRGLLIRERIKLKYDTQ